MILQAHRVSISNQLISVYVVFTNLHCFFRHKFIDVQLTIIVEQL